MKVQFNLSICVHGVVVNGHTDVFTTVAFVDAGVAVALLLLLVLFADVDTNVVVFVVVVATAAAAVSYVVIAGVIADTAVDVVVKVDVDLVDYKISLMVLL